MPVLFIYTLYVPAIPVVGTYMPWTAALLGLAWGHFNVKYVEGYTESADGRMYGFRKRTQVFRLLAYGALAGMAASGATAVGLLK